MKILLRADADASTGAGHVMRILTLARPLIDRGHDVTLQGSFDSLPWLDAVIADSGARVSKVSYDSLDVTDIIAGYDRLVVDSYSIEAASISAVARAVPTLAIIDGDPRGIDAQLYLDQNLGAESTPWGSLEPRVLAGASFALVRPTILAHRRDGGGRIRARAHVVVVMGGTDPTGAILPVVRSIVGAGLHISLKAVAPASRVDAVRDAIGSARHAQVMASTPDLPELFGWSDIVVSAAGTSAWDVCALGRPAVLFALVENQRRSLAIAIERGLAIGADAVSDPGSLDSAAALIESLTSDPGLRRSLATRSLSIFDGRGVARVAQRLETLRPDRDQ